MQDPAYKISSVRSCGGDPHETLTYTILEAHLSVLKTAVLNDTNQNRIGDAGETIDYAFTVENTGGVTLTNITISDPLLTVPGTIASLAPGARDSTTFSATYTLTQADIDAGGVTNQATATGTAPDGDTVSDLSDDPTDTTDSDPDADGEPDDPTVFVTQRNPELDVTKEAELNDDGSGYADAGETVGYRFTVENTGNVTLTNVTIEDPLVTVTGGPIASLAPGAKDTTSFTATKTLTQAEIDAGRIENVATGKGTDPDGEEVPGQSHAVGELPGTPTVYEVDEEPEALALTKTGTLDQGGDGRTDVGDVVTYTFTLENTGNVTVQNATVSDVKLGFSGGPADLAPGAVETMTATYALTQADIDAGEVDNAATASGRSAHGTDLEAEASWSQATDGVPEADFVKEAALQNDDGNGVPDAGETIAYTFTVTNTGNVTLSDLTIEDAAAEVTGGPLASLAPGATDSTTFTGTRTLTQADIDAGGVENLATLSGKGPGGTDLVRESRTEEGTPGDPTVTPLEGQPDVRLELVGELVDANDNGYPDAGEEIAYRIKVVNAGNVTLSDVDVEGLLAQAPDGPASLPQLDIKGGPLGSLAVGATDTGTFTARHTISQEDIDKGLVLAQARVRGIAPDNSLVEDLSDDPEEGADVDLNGDGVPDDAAALALAQNAVLEAAKAGELRDENDSGFADAGETILYTVTVTNSGNLTMLDVTPEDEGPRFDGAPGAGSLSA
ncbi:DUF7507 domain-containing protein, partial [Nitratireductor sp. GCM10026969]|uniref:DUF7507 domain-containing protein n=1 Tax=Nitratireductor sp. GCM10026969 TaxID=3252645 RepID=UPI003623DED2